MFFKFYISDIDGSLNVIEKKDETRVFIHLVLKDHILINYFNKVDSYIYYLPQAIALNSGENFRKVLFFMLFFCGKGQKEIYSSSCCLIRFASFMLLRQHSCCPQTPSNQKSMHNV